MTGHNYIDLTRNLISQLHDFQEKTKVGPSALLRGAKDIPDGLGAALINAWLNGQAQTARADHVAYVVERWATVARRVSLTPEMIAALRHEQDRTGVGAIALIKRAAQIPDGLKAAHLQHWLDGRVKTVLEPHYEAILSAWRELPDKKTGPKPRRPWMRSEM